MKEDQILTLHPTEAIGTVLPLATYEMAKQAIMEVFLVKSRPSLEEIISSVTKSLLGKTTTTITTLVPIMVYDLEVRKYIEQVPNTTPLQFQLRLIRC